MTPYRPLTPAEVAGTIRDIKAAGSRSEVLGIIQEAIAWGATYAQVQLLITTAAREKYISIPARGHVGWKRK
jgi:hypothetical protein